LVIGKIGDSNMDEAKIMTEAIAEWAKFYPDDQRPIDVTVVIDKSFGGALAAIRSKDAKGDPNEAAFVFVILIGIVFYIGFRPDGAYNKEAFIALTSVLGAAAGFFFGTKRQQP
jgi:hypothetical protein